MQSVDKSVNATKVQVYVDREAWRRFRGVCMERGLSTHKEIEQLVTQFVDEARSGQSRRQAS